MPTFTGTSAPETISYNFVSPTVTVSPFFQVTSGQADTIYAGGGNDYVDADGGNDYVDGGSGDDTLDGWTGDDYVYGGSGNDKLYGFSGNDTLDGGGGSDAAYGGDGDDYIYAVLGTPETIDGGAGIDWVNTANFAFDYAVNLATGLTNFAGEIFTNLENIYSGAGNDTLDGTAGANVMYGNSGDDFISSGNGADFIYAGFGDDTVYGGLGNDTMYGADGDDFMGGGKGNDYMAGEDGNDTYIVDAAGDIVAEYGSGVDLVQAAISISALAGNVENLDLLTGAINGTGNTLANIINGNAAGNTLTGLAGNDYLYGDAGADKLIGGAGRDSLAGGANADTFIFNLASESTGATADRIVAGGGAIAFEGAGAAAGDKFDLSGIDANTAIAGNQAFIWGGTGAGHISVISSGTNTVFRGNTDADGVFEFTFTVEDAGILSTAYTAADFFL